jgi:hypothetical protein
MVPPTLVKHGLSKYVHTSDAQMPKRQQQSLAARDTCLVIRPCMYNVEECVPANLLSLTGRHQRVSSCRYVSLFV